MEVDDSTLDLLSERDLWLLASQIGLPLDDGPSMETLRIRIRRAAW